jgi:hypothetical protein
LVLSGILTIPISEKSAEDDEGIINGTVVGKIVGIDMEKNMYKVLIVNYAQPES